MHIYDSVFLVARGPFCYEILLFSLDCAMCTGSVLSFGVFLSCSLCVFVFQVHLLQKRILKNSYQQSMPSS